MALHRKALIPIIALGAAVSLLASGCAPGQSGPSASPTAEGDSNGPERAEADLLIWADEPRVRALQDVAKKFGEANGITVAVQSVQDLQTNFITANQAGNGPDVIVGAHDTLGNMVKNGAVDPVVMTPAAKGEFSPVAIEAMTYNNQFYGVPYAVDTLALYRNKALVDVEPKSAEEMSAAAKGAGAEHPLCIPVGDAGDAFHMQPFYSSAGGYLFGQGEDGSTNVKDLGVGQPGSLAAAQKIGELGASGVLNTSISGENAIPLFTQGKCPYLVSGPWALDSLRKAKIDYAISAVPGFEGMGQAEPFVSVQGFFVASKGKNKSFAQSFLTEAANQPETAMALYNADPRPPALNAVLKEIAGSDPDIVAFAKFSESGLPMPAIPEMVTIWEPLGKAEASIVDGADPTTSMTAAGTAIAGMLK